MAPAMKAMKAMKAKAGFTATGAFAAVAQSTELKPKQVKTVITSYVELAATELKKRQLQVWRSTQHEVEEETRQTGPQGHQSFHQGTVCLQSQTCK